MFVVLIALLIILQTSTPIKAFVSGLFAFSYSVQDDEHREVLQKYNWQWVDMNVSPRELASFSSRGVDSLTVSAMVSRAVESD